MVDYFRGNKIVDEQVDELLNTYRTPFWLDKYGWFVRCDWNPGIGNFYLYTLPYAFGYFDISDSTIWKSTCLDKKNQYTYDAMHHLNYDVKPEQFPQLSGIQFYKLKKLTITCPISDHFWSMFPTFDHLTSCEILSNHNSEECQKQIQL
ncbi:unnamed protein product [Rotaria sp. Silwood1]|nr:unnamed protein product [Rotaria sp. Silwood1]CAF1472729.1 unnamed protein product [Rotaria sp. Silwood1]